MASLPDGAYGGQTLAGEQLRIVEAIWRACKDASLTDRDAVIALITADTESSFQTGPAVYMKDHNSVGPFQQRPLPTNPWWGTVAECEDPYTSARLFLRELVKIADRGSMTEGQAAQAVQRSAYPDRYQQRVDVGRALVQALNSGGKTVSVTNGAPFVQAAHVSTGSNLPVNRVVIHATVSPCVRGGARATAAYFQNQSAGGSAHYIVDPGEIVQCVAEAAIAWHAPPNRNSIGIELCDPMADSGGRELAASRWADADHEAMLRLAAAATAEMCAKYAIPMVRLSPADLLAGKRGVCAHADVATAWRQTDHWDVGAGFPWDRFMSYVTAGATPVAPIAPVTPVPPTQGDDMAVSPDFENNFNTLNKDLRAWCGGLRKDFDALNKDLRADLTVKEQEIDALNAKVDQLLAKP